MLQGMAAPKNVAASLRRNDGGLLCRSIPRPKARWRNGRCLCPQDYARLGNASRRITSARFYGDRSLAIGHRRSQRLRAMESAALASSIFLVARKRGRRGAGRLSRNKFAPNWKQIVRERVETLWDMGISGADLVIASVGAGLRAFTRFARVEYANGEEVPAERFLTEVETVVLETILARLSKEVGGKGGQYSLASLDTASRFYVLWRYTYGAAELEAGEAIIFANGTHVELDGQDGLTSGSERAGGKKEGQVSPARFQRTR